MDKREELKGLLKEVIQETTDNTELEVIKEKVAANEEANAKLLETNTELKTQLDSMQDKTFKLKGNAGEGEYVFKGYDTTRPTRNFKIACSKEEGDEVAGNIVKALTTGNTGAYAIPVAYSNALLGLAELQSVALSRARILNVNTTTIKMPAKGTRGTVDAQAFGTANKEQGSTLGQLVFTIDKRVGSYEKIYNDVLMDSNFDVVSEFIEPVMAESIGQNFDNEMFNGVEYTSAVSTTTNGVTASGTVGIAAAITFANLVETAYAVELERGVQPEWWVPRGAMKDIVSLVDSQGRPMFNPVPVSGAPAGSLLGYPITIVPSISNTPADGAIRLAFGDPKRYIIALRQGIVFQINPYNEMKEGITSFICYARSDGNVESTDAWATISRAD